jgi:hypothetical protein
VKFRDAIKQDWWKLLICFAGLGYALYNERRVIAYFAVAAIVAWPFYRLGKKDDERDWW